MENGKLSKMTKERLQKVKTKRQKASNREWASVIKKANLHRGPQSQRVSPVGFFLIFFIQCYVTPVVETPLFNNPRINRTRPQTENNIRLLPTFDHMLPTLLLYKASN
jgi:hypothetical protein